MNGVSRGDAVCAAYYLYCAAELNEGRKYPSDDSVDLFFKLVSSLGKTEQVAEFLEKYVNSAEKRNLLEPIKEDGERCFEDSNIRYEYREDRDVERNIRDASVVIDKNLVNLYRCFYVSDAGYRFFAKLTANFLLRKSCTRNFSLLEKLSEHVEKVVFDNSTTRFIADSVDISEAELKYLAFSYRCEVVPLLSEIIEETVEHGVSRQEFVVKVLDITPKEYQSLFDRNKALCSFGFINDSGDIEDETIRSIEIQSLDPFFDDFVKRADFSNTYELNSFNVGEEVSLVLQGAFAGKKSFSFLLYGKPGSGKTEYAKALAKA
ncbi:ATP-binding protein, partial [bacterium]|nr:ATP-binding protein [bacterium]